MQELKWRRTSKRRTFELDGAEAVSNLINKYSKTVLYQIDIYELKHNKGEMCDKCKVYLTMMIGSQDWIYDYEKSKHIRIGKYETLGEAKKVAQEIENLFELGKEIL